MKKTLAGLCSTCSGKPGTVIELLIREKRAEITAGPFVPPRIKIIERRTNRILKISFTPKSRVMEDDRAIVGVTSYAQDQLVEVVFVELPEGKLRPEMLLPL